MLCFAWYFWPASVAQPEGVSIVVLSLASKKYGLRTHGCKNEKVRFCAACKRSSAQ